MNDQLSQQDWLDQGLKILAGKGFTALKAEPMAKVMGVSRGSFYWHFADVAAFHAELLKRWREIAAEQIITGVEASVGDEPAIAVLLRRTLSIRLTLERAVRSWAASSPLARQAVQAIDKRRLGYIEGLLAAQGLPAAPAQARAQVLYWAFLGYALSDRQLPPEQQQNVINELIRIALHEP
ncbi:putative transcriptional regulator protein [Bradyrhizobium sp. ORS 285]|uniref:TetR/AcrR family transcriptional regulator n=1 Tax=Bradyrhizobium sp. ORS 285 TaxID=115808 RepID=UPI0002408FA0|nr:TetR/AcrR family transcriptional regulator [Bradyrhizobium sp. ORS 285]CCD88073.1 putative transcriptional regulator protein [Bradyrhizobium sp. ORS 285]SMX61940.1 putative transcriptional regulator protein [Bradyrhizobium sp. ORS 285]